jgi:hypothetical protein
VVIFSPLIITEAIGLVRFAITAFFCTIVPRIQYNVLWYRKYSYFFKLPQSFFSSCSDDVLPREAETRFKMLKLDFENLVREVRDLWVWLYEGLSIGGMRLHTGESYEPKKCFNSRR